MEKPKLVVQNYTIIRLGFVCHWPGFNLYAWGYGHTYWEAVANWHDKNRYLRTLAANMNSPYREAHLSVCAAHEQQQKI